MKISCIQMDMRLGEADWNFAHAEELVRSTVAAEHPDVVVLPETWNTGFFPKKLAPCADRDGKRTKSVFSALARELNVNIVCGSVANQKADGFYNTAYVFDRAGAVVAEYDKTHLFTPSGEHEAFQAGTHTCRFQLEGQKCGLIICYDIRFPELTRTMTLEGVDLLFVVAQWPEKRTMHLETLARARAIENQMFLTLCNSAASDTACGGHSAIIDPWGEYLAHAGDGETTITGDLDFSVIEGIRSSINVFRDRRPELYAGMEAVKRNGTTLIGKEARTGACLLAGSMETMVPFYRDVLGFQTQWDGGDFAQFQTVGGKLSFFMYSRRAFAKSLGERYVPPEGINQTCEVALWLPRFADVDEEYARLSRLNVSFPLGGPVTYPFGIRNFYVADPEGNLLEIGSTREI